MFKYRLYTTKRNKHLVEQIEVAASIWNHCIALTRRYYSLYGTSISEGQLEKHIARLRRSNPYWQKLDAQSVQDVIERLCKAYNRFFNDLKAGRPSFKN